MQMQGRTAIVTGGTGVIGRGLVSVLVEEGAKVVTASRGQAEPVDGVTHVPTDLANEQAVQHLIKISPFYIKILSFNIFK